MNARQVLYIDDDEDDQEIFQMALSEINDDIRCITTYDARLALNKLATQEWVPDLIFLDLNMPFMTGADFLEETKKQRDLHLIPIIVLSTSAQASIIQTMKEKGARDFLTKPGSYRELVSQLKSILR